MHTEAPRRLAYTAVENPPPPTNTLGPWCANSFNMGRVPLVIFTNERTLLSVIVTFKDSRTLPARFVLGVEALLGSLGFGSPRIRREIDETKRLSFARATNRSVLGSMNDFVNMVHSMASGLSLEEVSFELSGILCGPLKYHSPRDVATEILDR